jgi:hypothetical protein
VIVISNSSKTKAGLAGFGFLNFRKNIIKRFVKNPIKNKKIKFKS